MALILVGGGSRSGKSRYALARARAAGKRLCFLATAEPLDSEMRDRIAAHQRDRGPEFTTIEEPWDLAAVLDREAPCFDAIVIDCLTLWLSNRMLAGGADLDEEVDRLCQAAGSSPATVILVTNEVGCGIVPENELARRFRDLAGTANQKAAAAAAEVYWMVFGCPMKVK